MESTHYLEVFQISTSPEKYPLLQEVNFPSPLFWRKHPFYSPHWSTVISTVVLNLPFSVRCLGSFSMIFHVTALSQALAFHWTLIYQDWAELTLKVRAVLDIYAYDGNFPTQASFVLMFCTLSAAWPHHPKLHLKIGSDRYQEEKPTAVPLL